MSKLKRLAGETALYGLGSMLPRFLNFLLVPLHTIGMFNQAEYGQITKIYAFVAVVNVIYMFGMETAFFRFSTKEGTDKRKIFNLSQTAVLLISTLSSLLIILFAKPIASGLSIPSHSNFIVWIALTMWIDALVAIPFAQLRLQKKAFLFAAAKVVNVCALIGLNYYFLKFSFKPEIGIGYVFLANLIANGLFILFFLKIIFSWRPAWDKSISPQMLRYAYPVMITGIAGMVNEMFSRSMIDWWLPINFYKETTREEAGGLLGAAYKYAVFMNLGVQAFRYAAEPFFFSNATDKNSPQLFAKVNHYFVVAGCLVLLGVSLNMNIFKFMVGENFWNGLTVVPILLLAYLFLGIYYNMSVWFKLTDKTYFGTLITLAGVLVTVAGNYFLIPVAGFTGSSIAALLCYFTMTVACYTIGQRFYAIPYWIWKDTGYIIITYLLVIFVNQIEIETFWLEIAFHQVVFLTTALVFFLIERKNLLTPAT